MDNAKKYQTACARMGLGGEKLEEMIALTEQKKRTRGRTLRTALAAAAVAAAVGVTAMAAAPQARQAVLEFFGHELTLTAREEGGGLGFCVPELRLTEEEGRVILTVDGQAMDITDDLAAGEGYTYRREGENGTLEVRLGADLSCATVLCDPSDGSPVVVVTFPARTDPAGGVVYDAPGGAQEAGDGETALSPAPSV